MNPGMGFNGQGMMPPGGMGGQPGMGMGMGFEHMGT
jgi:hypothetical protein